MNIRLSPPSRNAERHERSRRVGPLSLLPLFFNLRGRKALVVGGSDAACWKAELLMAAGASVHVHAETLGAEFEKLVFSERGSQSLVWSRSQWCEADFFDAAVALADAENLVEATAFLNAGNASGVPVNVIDKPDFCTFQFGSIVNRSPVVVGISTDGAAPILGQAIRRRIESLLPLALADWAAIAQLIRREIAAKLTPGRQRRMFWEKFADLAFRETPNSNSRQALLDECEETAPTEKAVRGRITFVGIESADPELLTLKTLRHLQSADMIFFDEHVSSEMLELARREAKRIRVGGEILENSRECRELNDQLRQLAVQGQHVIWLGDARSELFGRQVEKRAAYEAGGIEVSVSQPAMGSNVTVNPATFNFVSVFLELKKLTVENLALPPTSKCHKRK